MDAPLPPPTSRPRDARTERPPVLTRPSKEEIARLPPYPRLRPNRIHVIRSRDQAATALAKLAEAGFVGFDTETRPSFQKDQSHEGPHVIQLATLADAYIVQLDASTPMDFLREVLESNRIVKVGFGLTSDRAPLYRKLGIQLGASVELSDVVKRLGYRQAVGVKAAVAIVLGQRLQKSRKVTTSNWALAELTASQLQYAADDAHAALAVFHALGRPGIEPEASRAA